MLSGRHFVGRRVVYLSVSIVIVRRMDRHGIPPYPRYFFRPRFVRTNRPRIGRLSVEFFRWVNCEPPAFLVLRGMFVERFIRANTTRDMKRLLL